MTEATTEAPMKPRSASMGDNSGEVRPAERPRGAAGAGFLTQYKPEQGKTTRGSTFVGAGLLIVWGAYFIYERLQIYAGDELWTLMVTLGIPLLFAVVLGTIAWRISFVSRRPSDFMIATEGEMKKVSWSSKREVIGSTKVVILFTMLMAVLLFAVDVLFQTLFKTIGVLKT